MTLDPTEVPTLLSKVVAHFLDLHSWQKGVLTLAVILFGTGGAHQLTTFFGATPPATTAPSVEGQPPAPAPTFGDKVSPWAMGVGGSFVAGFLLGFALRIFVRITMAVVLVGICVMLLLSRFHIVNLDFSQAKTEYSDSVHWVADQAEHVEKSVASHLPHSGSGLFGAFAGFRRRKLRI
jgi:uncharacterized membrane protein (Fun14 family)